jgi:hypothetical protein
LTFGYAEDVPQSDFGTYTYQTGHRSHVKSMLRSVVLNSRGERYFGALCGCSSSKAVARLRSAVSLLLGHVHDVVVSGLREGFRHAVALWAAYRRGQWQQAGLSSKDPSLFGYVSLAVAA